MAELITINGEEFYLVPKATYERDSESIDTRSFARNLLDEWTK